MTNESLAFPEVDDIEALSRVEEALAAQQKGLVDEIRRMLVERPHGDVSSVQIEVFAAEEVGSVSIGVYFRGRNPSVRSGDDSFYVGRHLAMAENVELPSIDTDSYGEEKWFLLDRIAEAEIEWFGEAWQIAGGEDYPLPVFIEGHEGLAGNEVIELAPPMSRLIRHSGLNLPDHAELLGYYTDLGEGVFEWIIRSAEPIAPPVSVERTPGAAAVVEILSRRILRGIGIPTRDEILEAGWTTDHGSWTCQSVHTKRKRSNRYYSRVTQRLERWPFEAV